jgi:hypothetical protein
MVVVVTPVPVGLLVAIVTLVEIHMIPMGVVFPLAVVNDFAIPVMVIMVVRVVVAGVHGATGQKHWKGKGRCEYRPCQLT